LNQLRTPQQLDSHGQRPNDPLIRGRVFVVGITSPLGHGIASAALARGARVIAVSRSRPIGANVCNFWKSLRLDLGAEGSIADLGLEAGDILICAAPLRVLARAVDGFEFPPGVRITAISSASATTKANSPFPRDAQWAKEMRAAEVAITNAVQGDASILRPTMIYGSGRDRNVAHIARKLARVHVLPLIGGGSGLRAPVHVDDLAQVALAAACGAAATKPIHVPGGERLTFREMVRRIAAVAHVRYTEVPMPLLPFTLGARAFAHVGRIGWSFAACARMAEDLTVPDDAAMFGVARREFHPDARAVGQSEARE
jgi:nucleoside-diphosphate-sugar epimerase